MRARWSCTLAMKSVGISLLLLVSIRSTVAARWAGLMHSLLWYILVSLDKTASPPTQAGSVRNDRTAQGLTAPDRFRRRTARFNSIDQQSVRAYTNMDASTGVSLY